MRQRTRVDRDLDFLREIALRDERDRLGQDAGALMLAGRPVPRDVVERLAAVCTELREYGEACGHHAAVPAGEAFDPRAPTCALRRARRTDTPTIP